MNVHVRKNDAIPGTYQLKLNGFFYLIIFLTKEKTSSDGR